jgi:hypothetical protein
MLPTSIRWSNAEKTCKHRTVCHNDGTQLGQPVSNSIKIIKFYSPTDALKSCFKRILKFTLKQLLHVSVQSPSSGIVLFELATVMVFKIIS